MKNAFPVHCRRLAAVVLAVLAVPPVVEATDLLLSDIRILGGDGIGLEDTPPEAWLAGVALGIEEGRRLRVSLEFLHGQIYGWDYCERRRILITPVFEYRFWPERRVQPYLGGGVGLALGFRSVAHRRERPAGVGMGSGNRGHVGRRGTTVPDRTPVHRA